MHKKIYAAISDMKYFSGSIRLKIGDPVFLVKDPDNVDDPEAIRVVLPSHGQVGYIANSAATVPRGCRSAGRIYDTFRKQTLGIVQFIFQDSAIIELKEAANKPGAEEKEMFIMYRTPSEQI